MVKNIFTPVNFSVFFFFFFFSLISLMLFFSFLSLLISFPSSFTLLFFLLTQSLAFILIFISRSAHQDHPQHHCMYILDSWWGRKNRYDCVRGHFWIARFLLNTLPRYFFIQAHLSFLTKDFKCKVILNQRKKVQNKRTEYPNYCI